MSSSDSDNVVAATPPKLTKLCKRKRKPNIKAKHSIEDYLIHVPINNNISKETLETSTISVNFNQPYIYYSIEEIMHLPSNNLLNNNIHTIGLYKFHGNNEHYLTIHWIQSNNIKISLNFKYVQRSPNDNEIISVYGSMHENIFVVKFYKVEIKAIVDKYIKDLKYLRNIIPKNNLMCGEMYK